jgi:sodium transport system permease protein
MACNRLMAILDHWTEEVGKANLVAGGMPAQAVRPFEVESANLAGEAASKSTSIWSRMLPMLLLLWAMTGAFYPAVDLCAGEKERGTLETLLSSPAERSEIVLGKLLTIMVFSMVTAALNLLCGGVMGSLVFRQQENFGGPPPLAVLWLALALVPVSALFSALCLALASFARSTKEGQYYLMPLLMLSLPMAILPMIPGVELKRGNSLIPISGIVLLLKALLEGSYIQALQYLPVVLAVTMAACWLAVRWAVEQFNKESVLFRESERFAVGLWLRHLLRDRGPAPSAAEGLFCGVLILVLVFVCRSAIEPPVSFEGFARMNSAVQLAAILAPALLMAVFLTSSPRQTLLLRLPRWKMVPAAAVLALAMHPFVIALNSLVAHLYPMAPEMIRDLGTWQAKFAAADAGLLLVCFAAVPAVCEELAFRGFILAGCRNLGNNGRAVLVSAIFFGATHAFLQQSINACLLGIVLGYLAVKSGSLLPGIIFHFLHNAMMVLSAKVTPELVDRLPGLNFLVQPGTEGPAYHWPVYLFGGVASLAVLGWFTWFPEARTPEDLLQEVFKQSADNALRDDAAEGLPAT